MNLSHFLEAAIVAEVNQFNHVDFPIYSDMSEHVREIYGISVSTAAIRAMTDPIIDTVKAWQPRPLDSHTTNPLVIQSAAMAHK